MFGFILKNLRPGSPEAREMVCKCDPFVNKNGRGQGQYRDGTGYIVDPKCLLHRDVPELAE